ncbi:hypothetical protein SAMN05216188_101850 [Lentzea xinjiangensis]|uniref:Uncharacterized protein n=1 Tax=Lentzea xinjiangensis TaxID=402600 RepID=A0A1H9BM73_9PSEU|nr:hypothetical protein [Lentzea xinjiangensis]SEP90060.1 hypothetical protein SAMN05216188_101850 [Lentzea xinjiangensis]
MNALFGDSDADAVEEPEIEEHGPQEQEHDGIGWKVLILFICGGLVITALAVAFMVWVIEALVL